MPRSDRYAVYGLTAADEVFRRAVRDGFKGAGLNHKQYLQALEFYRDHVRPGMDQATLAATFHDFAAAKGWSVEGIVAARGVHGAIEEHGPEAVIATPTAEEDQATITRANELLAKDSAAYFADEELQEAMFEALERQAATEATPELVPPVTNTEIERRIGRRDVERFERMMREQPQEYWRSERHQSDYRAALEHANLPDEAPTTAAEPSALAPVEPRPDAA
jgi:hypothetical protein